MSEKIALNASNFSHFAFDPRSQYLSAEDQKKVITQTVVMGIFTLGIGILVTALCRSVQQSRYRDKKFELEQKKFGFNFSSVEVSLKLLQLETKGRVRIINASPEQQESVRAQVNKEMLNYIVAVSNGVLKKFDDLKAEAKATQDLDPYAYNHPTEGMERWIAQFEKDFLDRLERFLNQTFF